MLTIGALSVHGASPPPDTIAVDLHVTVPGDTPDNAQHNEYFWSLRLDQMLLYFFGTGAAGKAHSAAGRVAG
jgi:hypothetical protein